jgi:nitroreductase
VDPLYPLAKYKILPFTDTDTSDNVNDHLAKILSLVFSSQTDAQGSKFAYFVLDKNQFSLKVIKFTEQDPRMANFFAGWVIASFCFFLLTHVFE